MAQAIPWTTPWSISPAAAERYRSDSADWPDQGAIQGDIGAHVAYVAPPRSAPARPPEDAVAAQALWRRACYATTPRVQSVGMLAAFLDLGRCTEDEALAVAWGLHARLAAAGVVVRVGVGASLSLAQLAFLHADAAGESAVSESAVSESAAVVGVAAAAAAAFLRAVPVRLLPALYPQGYVAEEVVARLERYGLYTLGHVAHLGEAALARHFGAVGRYLAAVAAGRDARPVMATPQPPSLRVRLRLCPAVPPEHIDAGAA